MNETGSGSQNQLVRSVIALWRQGLNTAEIAGRLCARTSTVDRIVAAYLEGQYPSRKDAA